MRLMKIESGRDERELLNMDVDEIMTDATEYGEKGIDIKTIADLAKKELSSFLNRLDFAGCLKRVDDIIFDTVGAKEVSSAEGTVD